MPDPELVQRIRTIFLHERTYVSIFDAMELLGWSSQEMEAALAGQDIEVVTTCSGKAIPREEVVAMAREFWPLEVIEDALGRAAATVLPRGLLTRRITARLPRYQADCSSTSRRSGRRRSGSCCRSSSMTWPANISTHCRRRFRTSPRRSCGRMPLKRRRRRLALGRLRGWG